MAASDAEPEGVAAPGFHRPQGRLRSAVGWGSRAARHAIGRCRRRGDRGVAGLGVRRRAAPRRRAHRQQRRPALARRRCRPGRPRRQRLRGHRDRAPRGRRGGAAGRPVVLHGVGRALGPDEADGAGAVAPRGHPVPAGRAADHRLRPLRDAPDAG
nr:hypothetical protein [Angustibacter aerolatus]